MPAAKTLLFIHSAGPQGRNRGSGPFIAWLKRSLGAAYAVRHPAMPDPEAPDYGPWKDVLASELTGLPDRAVLVGHSLGGSVLMKYLSEERCGKAFSGLFLVAAPFWGLEGWEYEAFRLKRGFARKLRPLPRIFIYHSRDDHVVARDHPLRYARDIPQATLREVDGHGHAFDSGTCPELIRDIKGL